MKEKLKTIPDSPGVYLFKNKRNKIIYIGKAKSLRKRVYSYFHKTYADLKVSKLVKEREEVAYITTRTEIEAILLEAQLIQEYKPKYNILLKSGSPFRYLLFTKPKLLLPRLKIIKTKKEKGKYFGPFYQKRDAQAVFDYLTRLFKLFVCNKKLENGCLDYHLGKCAGNCRPDFDRDAYLTRLEIAFDVLKGRHKKFVKKIEEKIFEHNKQLEFERARELAKYLKNFDTIFSTIEAKFSWKKYEPEIAYATATHHPQEKNFSCVLYELQKLLELDTPIKTIDCFDVSHFQGSFIVGSCIRFLDGKPDKNRFRKFKIKTLKKQNDYAALREIVTRRYRNSNEVPDLVLIDGGKGQRNAVLPLLGNTSCVSLAKKEELLITKIHPKGVKLNIKSPIGQLIISIRDYAHHFAINYHRIMRKKSYR